MVTFANHDYSPPDKDLAQWSMIVWYKWTVLRQIKEEIDG